MSTSVREFGLKHDPWLDPFSVSRFVCLQGSSQASPKDAKTITTGESGSTEDILLLLKAPEYSGAALNDGANFQSQAPWQLFSQRRSRAQQSVDAPVLKLHQITHPKITVAIANMRL